MSFLVWAEATGPRECRRSRFGLEWVGLSSGRGVWPSGQTSSSSPGYPKFSDDVSLTSVTSFRRPFSLIFSPFLSLILPLIPFLVFVWFVKA